MRDENMMTPEKQKASFAELAFYETQKVCGLCFEQRL